jgi:hypothetical protein
VFGREKNAKLPLQIMDRAMKLRNTNPVPRNKLSGNRKERYWCILY